MFWKEGTARRGKGVPPPRRRGSRPGQEGTQGQGSPGGAFGEAGAGTVNAGLWRSALGLRVPHRRLEHPAVGEREPASGGQAGQGCHGEEQHAESGAPSFCRRVRKGKTQRFRDVFNSK